jgi:hypothetical protein
MTDSFSECNFLFCQTWLSELWMVLRNVSAIILLGLWFCLDDEIETHSELSVTTNATAQKWTTYHSYPTTGHAAVITAPITWIREVPTLNLGRKPVILTIFLISFNIFSHMPGKHYQLHYCLLQKKHLRVLYTKHVTYIYSVLCCLNTVVKYSRNEPVLVRTRT